MKNIFCYKSPVFYFAAGLFFNLILFAVLELSPAAHFNLQFPEGAFQNNIWGVSSDVWSYYEPAKNFAAHGVFGVGTVPDIHRTVGYPFVLAACIKLFGPHWHFALLLFQSIFFACIYPLVFLIVKLFFNDNVKLAAYTAAVSLLFGTYLCYVQTMYTDTLFALLFIAGLYFGLRSVRECSIKYFILHIVSIGCASQVRPTLALYPAAFVFLSYAFVKQNRIAVTPKLKSLAAVSIVLLIVLSNGPAIRNYINWKQFVATDVMANNLFRYLGKNVSHDKGLDVQYRTALSAVETAPNDIEKMKLENAYAVPLLKAHPLSTVKWIAGYGAWICFESHWTAVFNYYNLNWYQHHSKFEVSTANRIVCAAGALAYCAVYILCMIYAFRLFKGRKWALLIGLFFMMMPLFASFTGGGGARMRLSVEWFFIAAALSVILEKEIKSDPEK